MDNTSMPNKPVATYRDGRLKATLWANENRDGDTYYTVNLAKVYEDRNGKLQETNSFSDSEILRVIELGKEARAHALQLRRDHRPERDQAPRQSRDEGGPPRRFRGTSERSSGPRMER